MPFDQIEEQSVPQSSGASNKDMKYELQVINLLAARLASNPLVEDYWIITSPENVCAFDDVIAIITYTSGEKHVIMLQLKHSEKRMRLITHDQNSLRDFFKKVKKQVLFEGEEMEYLEIPLYTYLFAYNEIMEKDLKNKKFLENLEDIPFQNYFFGIFTTMGKEVQIESEKGIFTAGELELSPGNPLSFVSTNDLTSKMPLISTLPNYNELASKLYFFIEQANSIDIYKDLQLNIPSFTNHMIDNLYNSIEKSMNRWINGKMECFPLTKKMFLESSLEVSLSQLLKFSMDDCNDLKPMIDDTFNMWQSIFKEHNVTLLLHDALLRRHFKIIDFFLNYKVNPEVKGNEGLTGIQLAQQLGNSKIFLTLLSNKFSFLLDTNHKNYLNARKYKEYEDNFELLLYDLFLINDMNFVKFLLQHIAPNVTDTSKCSVLYSACLKGNMELVSELLNYNANPHLQNDNAENSLHAASRGNNFDIFKLILEKGVDPTLKNNHGSTCLHLACESGNLEIVQTLIDAKLDPNELNFDEENCLHAASAGSNVNIVKLLLNHSSKVDLKRHNKYGHTYLHLACFSGNLEIVQALIEWKLDPNELDFVQNNCLHAACIGNNGNIVKLLLNHSSKVNIKQKNKTGWTCLHLACKNGNLDIVQTLIELELDPNELNFDEENCLYVACAGNDINIVKLLLNPNFKVDIKQKNKEGWTYLHSACRNGNLEIVQTLIELKLDPNALDFDQNNCLHVACGGSNVNIVKLLLNHSSKVNLKQRNKYGHTYLHVACAFGNLEIVQTLIEWRLDPNELDFTDSNCLHVACSESKVDIVKLLLNHNFKVNLKQQNKHGHTYLHLACKSGNLDIVQTLIESKLDPNELNFDEDNCLHVACAGSNVNVVKLLLNHSFKINLKQRNKYGHTYLHLACNAGNVEIVQTLIESKLDANELNFNGDNCLHLACIRSNVNIVKLLLSDSFNVNLQQKNKYGWTCLHLACLSGNLEIVQTLIELKLDPNELNFSEENCLHAACVGDNVNIVKLLLSNNFNVNLQQKNKFGWTCLHLACKCGNLEIVQTLIALELDPNELDFDKENCLHLACRGGNVNIVKLLLNDSFKVNIKQKNKDGWTCLHLACASGNLEIVKTLIESELDPNELDFNKNNCLHVACAGNNVNIVKLLLNDRFKVNRNQKNKYGCVYLDMARQKGNSEIIQTLTEWS